MKRNVSKWAPLCALIGISLALISCAKKDANSSLPSPSSNYASVTTGFAPVVMVVLPNGAGICTGTFVSPKAVLTAAHCTQRSGRYSVVSSFGTFSTYTVENYGGPADVGDENDISFLIFDDAVASSSQVYGVGDSVSSGDTLRLVGFGCNNLNSRTGAGVKRTGTNVVSSIGEFVEFLTPSNTQASFRGILGAENRAGSCFGDSGGPALKAVGDSYVVVGVTHAGGTLGDNIISQYSNATSSANRNFLAEINGDYSLGISGI